ncbi:MAG: histidine triad nucleotide-binding protein [Chloroherpetonaceae bacterium]|nr:histidine triad nucleotide-binding protein [Chloroherpetonaceae bacterium]
MENCIFCKIASGAIPSKKVYEDEEIFAFHDINPVAPIHILIIPKKHIASLVEVTTDDLFLLGKMMHVAKQLAAEFGLSDKGYRININTNADGGQTVFHLHVHLIGGKRMGWPPFPTI